MAGYYRPDPNTRGWVAISDGRSAFVDEIANPWDEWELGMRVHDELLDIAHHTCADALMRTLLKTEAA